MDWPNETIFLPEAPGVDWDVVERRRADVTPETPAEWRNFLESLLTPQPCVFHRNLEISAFYAALYLRHPSYFKWAAMAALASRHVRTALLPYHLPADETGFVTPAAEGRSLGQLHLNDLKLIRDTNNAIFHDIAWFHLAYDMDPTRAEALRPKLDTETGRHLNALEEARRCGGRGAWEANLLILHHEQVSMVQQRFDLLSDSFARWLSLGATMSYQHSGTRARRDRIGSFYLFMLSRRPALLLKSHSLPRMTRLDHRWEWIANRLYPQFRSYEEGDSTHLTKQLSQIFKDLAKLYEKKVCTLPHAF